VVTPAKPPPRITICGLIRSVIMMNNFSPRNDHRRLQRLSPMR
jgi:hypothetical protein